MIIIQYSDSVISFIPKFNFNDAVLQFQFTNETTKEVTTREPYLLQYQNDIVIASVIMDDFIEPETFYNLKIVLRDALEETLYKDKLFWTSNQSIDSYSINNGDYTTPNIDNNSYITI